MSFEYDPRKHEVTYSSPALRRGKIGTWSHKPGKDVVRNLDASGKIIYDPETANRDYVDEGIDYSAFIGYYQVLSSCGLIISVLIAAANIATKTNALP